VLGAIAVVAAEVATIVDLGGLVEGATGSVDSMAAALAAIGAVRDVEALDCVADDGAVERSSWGPSLVALPSSRVLRSSTSVITAKTSVIAARALVQRGTRALDRGGGTTDCTEAAVGRNCSDVGTSKTEVCGTAGDGSVETARTGSVSAVGDRWIGSSGRATCSALGVDENVAGITAVVDSSLGWGGPSSFIPRRLVHVKPSGHEVAAL